MDIDLTKPPLKLKFYDVFWADLAQGNHRLGTGSGQERLALSNTAPNVSDVSLADISEISPGNGYNAGGLAASWNQDTWSQDGATFIINGIASLLASGGDVGPFRYGIVYSNRLGSGNEFLIGWYDFGSALTLLDGNTLIFNCLGPSLVITG